MGILDKYVREIVEKSHFLSDENLEDLRKLIPVAPSPETEEDLEDPSSGAPDLIQLSGTLRKLIRSTERMYKKATMSDDVEELKKASASLKQVLDVAIKYSDKIAASDRAIKVENALVSAVNSFCDRKDLPDLKAEFLDHLQAELS